MRTRSAPTTSARTALPSRQVNSLPPRLRGYIVLFDVLSLPIEEDGKQFLEVLRPGAFEDWLRTVECNLLVNHNPSMRLGSTSTDLQLWEDDRGLAFDCALPSSDLGRGIVEAFRRQELTGTSFSMMHKHTLDRFFVAADGRLIREIWCAPLFHVSLLHGTRQPAHPSTARFLQLSEGGQRV